MGRLLRWCLGLRPEAEAAPSPACAHNGQPDRTLVDALCEYGAEMQAHQRTRIDEWQELNDPHLCSRCLRPTDLELTVDGRGFPVCWGCVGLYGLAYDHAKRWNPETRSVETVELPPSAYREGWAIGGPAGLW